MHVAARCPGYRGCMWLPHLGSHVCVPVLMSPRKQRCAGFPPDAAPLSASRDEREHDPAVGQEPPRGAWTGKETHRPGQGRGQGRLWAQPGPRQRAGEGRALTSRGRSRPQYPVSPAHPPGSHWEVLVPFCAFDPVSSQCPCPCVRARMGRCPTQRAGSIDQAHVGNATLLQ